MADCATHLRLVSPLKSSPRWRRAVALLGGILGAALAAAAPWPHELGDVPPDPAVHWGRLENGLRYVVRRNAEPAGRVSLVLQVAAGSVDERDDQRGYAHFVEHMLFRGTKHHPANSLVGLLQHEGLAMGADSSAFTNYLSTFYNLDLPQNSEAKITLGLSILRDFADGAAFTKADLKLEAKVIDSERRTRESTSSQLGEALVDFLHPGSLITHRQPIGTPETMAAATPERLAAFYHTWYRPSRLTVIAVGDAEPALLERLIREQFASLQPAQPEEPRDPDLGLRAAPPEDLQVRFFPNPTPTGTSSILYSLAAVEPAPDTVARRREQLVRSAGFAMLNTRLIDLARTQPNDVGETQATWSVEFGYRRLAMVRIDTRADLWRRGVRYAEQELRRALLHGFTADEVKLQVQGFRNSFQEARRTAANRASPALAEGIRANLENNFIFSSPDTDWEIAEPVLRDLTPEQCTEAFRAVWAPANRRLAVLGHYPLPLTDQDLHSAYEESAYAHFIAEKEAQAIAPFDYTNFGPPGRIEDRRHDDRVDIHSVTFANGVRLNLKRTDYEQSRVYLRLRLGRGMTTEPPSQPGLGAVASLAFLAGGLGRYDNTELGRRFAGDTLSFNFSAEEDAFYFTGYASPDKLEKLLQAVTAFLTDPAFRLEGFQNGASHLQSLYPAINREPAQFLRSICPLLMANGDQRYGVPLPAKVAARRPEQVTEWLRPVLAKGAIELGLAGDLDVESAVSAVARTLGALAPRQADPPPDAARKVMLPAKPIEQTFLLDDSEPDKAAVRIYWPGVDNDDYRASRRLQVLAGILSDRVRVRLREELGVTYGPQFDVWGSDVWPGYGYFFVEVETAPKMAERVATLTRQIAAAMAAKGVTQDEFERYIVPRRAVLKQELRNNSYWTYYVLSHLQETPRRVEWPLTRVDDYQSMRLEEINEAARRFLGGPRVYTFIARPRKLAGP